MLSKSTYKTNSLYHTVETDTNFIYLIKNKKNRQSFILNRTHM